MKTNRPEMGLWHIIEILRNNSPTSGLKSHKSLIKNFFKEKNMFSKNKDSLLFHSPNAVSRIALWSTIVAWIVLVLGVLTFANQAYSIVTNWASIAMSLPASLFDKIAAFAKLFADSFVPVIYFLVLRGVTLGLNLLQDLFYGNTEAEDVETVVVVE
jgi:hypothetical protein